MRPGLRGRTGQRWFGEKVVSRSEERRVGEEGRSRGGPYHLKKKNRNNYKKQSHIYNYVMLQDLDVWSGVVNHLVKLEYTMRGKNCDCVDLIHQDAGLSVDDDGQ